MKKKNELRYRKLMCFLTAINWYVTTGNWYVTADFKQINVRSRKIVDLSQLIKHFLMSAAHYFEFDKNMIKIGFIYYMWEYSLVWPAYPTTKYSDPSVINEKFW
jgi:hypothetical protein